MSTWNFDLEDLKAQAALVRKMCLSHASNILKCIILTEGLAIFLQQNEIEPTIKDSIKKESDTGAVGPVSLPPVVPSLRTGPENSSCQSGVVHLAKLESAHHVT